MSSNSLRRIQNEMGKLLNNKQEYSEIFTIRTVDENIFNLRAIISAPPDSLYEGYAFEVDIIIPTNYPQVPPNIKFITPIEHLNINKDGNICLNILKDAWNPSISIGSILITISQLLSDPNDSDPFNSHLVDVLKTNKKEYKKIIRKSCKKNAIKI